MDDATKPMLVQTDCFHFNGYKPCRPHKEHNVHCKGCKFYRKTKKNILIIKLQAAGEVIRNTPLLHRIKKEYPLSKIFWITNYPEFVPENEVFKVMRYNAANAMILMDIEFDIVYSLDKDLEACALANRVKSKIKRGFSQRDGVIIPFGFEAYRKWKTGIFDDLMKGATKHYIEDIFELCGFEFNEEKYILPDYIVPKININQNKTVIALNTGVGLPWLTRLYSEKNWIHLAKSLKKKGYEVIITGGPDEHEKNMRLAKLSGAKYFGTFSYRDFIGLLSYADIVVTCVTLAFHVAVGLEKKIVLLNNIFNKHEFYMYGKGIILEPDLPCLMCYKTKFDSKCPTTNCMDLILPEKIINAVEELKA